MLLKKKYTSVIPILCLHYSPLFPRLCDETNGIVLKQQDINRTNVKEVCFFFPSEVTSAFILRIFLLNRMRVCPDD